MFNSSEPGADYMRQWHFTDAYIYVTRLPTALSATYIMNTGLLYFFIYQY